LSTPGRSQDSQSLGDLARQLRSQKSGAQPKTVINNDELPSTSAVTILGLGKASDPKGSTKLGTKSFPLSDLAEWESFVKKIDSMDRDTLLKLALQGTKADFPGRSSWEERLFTAKQLYVSQGSCFVPWDAHWFPPFGDCPPRLRSDTTEGKQRAILKFINSA
jgi:hypothetical protein